MAKTRRAYTGASVETQTTTDIDASGTAQFTVSAATNWPYGTDPYYVVVSPGTASEEKILVTRTGSTDTTINIASESQRGQDGTSAVYHANNSTIYPVFTAVDADESNELASTWTTKGDIVAHGASTFERLPVGTNNYVLQANSSASSGLAWGQVDTASIADNAVTTAKLNDNAVDETKIADGLLSGHSTTLFKSATLTGTISSASGTMTMAITSDPHNLFDTAASNQVEANFNGFMFTRPTNQTDTNARVYFRDRDDYAQMVPYDGNLNDFATYGTKWYGQLWNVRDTAHFDFQANNTQTNTITLECIAFLTY